MNHYIKLGLVTIALSASLAMADDAEPGKGHPCHAIHKLCKAAGFKGGHHKTDGKGMWVDCVQPLIEGKPVAGVTTPPSDADIQACKAHKAEHMKGKRRR